jgi:chromosomal replication initiator protein
LAENRGPARLAARRRRLRQAELLVIEDVDQLAGHESALRELANTIDAALADGTSIVVTSRFIPAAMLALDARLRGRLVAGLVVNIASPQRPARLALLSTFARQRGIALDERAGRALADAQHASAGELLAALETLALHRAGPIDRAAVRELANSGPAGRRLRIATVSAKVARRYRLSTADLQGRSRRRSVAIARSLAMYLCRQLTGSHLRQIGEYLGGRDHTTVLHGCQKIEQLLEHDAAIRAEVAELRSEMTGQRPDRLGRKTRSRRRTKNNPK